MAIAERLDGPIPPAVLDRAIAWSVTLRSGSAGEAQQAACAAWRAANVLHERAWQALQSMEDEMAGLPAPAARLGARTLAAARRGRRRSLGLIGGLGAAGAAGWLSISANERGADGQYAAATGEQRDIHLPDGTHMRLNTGSRARWSAVDGSPTLTLEVGEASIEHTGGVAAPVQVATPQAVLHLESARVLLRTDDRETALRIQAGSARVRPRGVTDSHDAVMGDALRIAAGRVSTLPDKRLDPEAWLDGALVARQARLDDFLAELGRYRQGWLRCDPAVAGLRVSGVYQVDDTDRVLAVLTRTLPLRLDALTRYWVTVTAA